MEKELEQLSPSRRTAARTLFEAFKILKKEGGQLPGRQVIDKIRENLELSEWEKIKYEKTGYIRWESILHFYTIDCIKAGLRLPYPSHEWFVTSRLMISSPD